MKLKDIIKQVSQENNLPEEVVTLAYKSYWKFIKNTIQELPLKEDLSEEEFNKLRTSFNLPSLGKLYVTWESYLKTKRKFKYYNEHIKNKKD